MAFLQTARHNRPVRRFSILAMLRQMHGLARQRSALRNLEPHLLADIGIRAEDAMTEANRPFWDRPASLR